MPSNLIVVLPTYPIAASETLIDFTAAIAKDIDASVTGLSVLVDFPDVKNPLAEVVLQVQQHIAETEMKSAAAGEALLAKLAKLSNMNGLEAHSRSIKVAPAGMGDAISKAVRLYEFVVMPVEPNKPSLSGLAETVIFEGGRPVILVPKALPKDSNLETVVVAYDFGRSATRALFDARPFLKTAKRVKIVVVLDEGKLADRRNVEISACLDRMGVRGEVVEIDTPNKGIGEALQGFALQQGAGLMVMGAFGHSRLRQFVLGGATSDVLDRPRIPVLMSY